VRQHDDPAFLVAILQVGAEPLELLVTKGGVWIRHVVQDDEVHPLVVKGVVGLAESLLVSLSFVQGCVVFAGQKLDVLDLEFSDYLAELLHTPPPRCVVVGCVRQVASETRQSRAPAAVR